VDPRLARQLTAAGEGGPVHAVLVVADGDDVAAGLVAAASAGSGLTAGSVRHLPRANALVVTAPAAWLRAALEDPRLLVASATTTDVFPW